VTRILYLTVASLIIIFIVRTCPEYVDLQILNMAKVAQLGPYMDFYHIKDLQKNLPGNGRQAQEEN
jgi:hypothetical protein